MKSRLSLFLLSILVIVACSKSDSPTPAVTAGCSVSFKGTTHSFTIAICVDATGGSTVDGLTGTNVGGTMAFVIARDSSDPDANSLSLNLNTNDLSGASVYSANVAITSQPTITRTGKNWTFSGTAMNNASDSGAISGTCSCTN